MDPRTLRKICKSLVNGENPVTRIEGYSYIVKTDGDDVVLIPVSKVGSIANSAISCSKYAYTNGGPIFRRAVEAAKEIAESLREKRAAVDKIPAFMKDLAYSSNVLFFDEQGHDYDLACANAAIERKEKIFQLSWTAQGYEITHIFNE